MRLSPSKQKQESESPHHCEEWQLLNSQLGLSSQGKPLSCTRKNKYLCYSSKCLYHASHSLNNFPILSVWLRVWFKIGSALCIKSSWRRHRLRTNGRKGGKKKKKEESLASLAERNKRAAFPLVWFSPATKNTTHWQRYTEISSGEDILQVKRWTSSWAISKAGKSLLFQKGSP